ncbi:MAG: hypothetical protein J7623_28700 [Chitinophaga sp.]|uniref:hypothetical protein n=1 Tax=Chitinophaga sp. TaxID=1869181 RepID=UPI001B2F1EDC|nr:hypothetical protein [Chitinophaga sp.]MBO9732657.1 hypothetical protein [Chitinophaga sp.]
MYRKLYRPFLAMMSLFISSKAFTQHLGDTKFEDYFAVMPVPSSTIDITDVSAGSKQEAANVTSEAQRKAILRSFFPLFKSNVEQVSENKRLLNNYSIEEQQMMQRYKAATNGIDEEGQLVIFALVMEGRPLLSSGKLSWSAGAAAFSARGKKYHEQLLAIERIVNWPLFFREAEKRSPVQFLRAGDPEIFAIDAQMNAELSHVPTKKVKVFENSDELSELPDYALMVKIASAADNKRQQVLRKRHIALYQWWKENEWLLRQSAYRLDTLVAATGNGAALTGADQPLLAMIADCQERIWHGLAALGAVTGMMAANTTQAAGSRQQVEEMITMQKKMEAAQQLP